MVRFQNGFNKVVTELSGVQFWSEIIIMRARSILKSRVPNCTPLSSITINNSPR